MALRDLTGAQCGDANALVRLTHHVTRDKALVQEGLRWNTETRDSQGFSQTGERLSDDWLSDFLHEPTQPIAPQTFRMDSLLKEMHEIDRSRVAPLVGPGVAHLASEDAGWAQQFLTTDSSLDLQNDWSQDFLDSSNAYGLKSSPDLLWAHEYLSNVDSCGDWQDESAAKRQAELGAAATALTTAVEDPKLQNTEFMKFVRNLESKSKSSNWSDEFLSEKTGLEIPDTWSTEFVSEVEQTSDRWVHQFDPTLNAGSASAVTIDSEDMSANERDDFWHQMEEEWSRLASDESEKHPWLADFNQSATNNFKDYLFEEDNPMREHPDPLNEGKKCLKEGDLPSAVLFFEAAVQQSPLSSESWLLLGATHAENEQDPVAICALKKCVELDPLNLTAWMALATSYTNESYQTLACNCLKEWISCHPKYSHLCTKEEASKRIPKAIVSSLAPRELIEEVETVLVAAANLQPGTDIDPEVQAALGIVFNLSGEYDKAVDCFQAALQAQPNDAKLWNKLGATLANSDQSAEAVEAYRHALELSPGFIRCRYNLGISCINLGAHRQAMEHFLEALNMQAAGRGPKGQVLSVAVSDNIWATLRICLTRLNLQHLLTAVEQRDLVKLNKEFGVELSSVN